MFTAFYVKVQQTEEGDTITFSAEPLWLAGPHSQTIRTEVLGYVHHPA